MEVILNDIEVMCVVSEKGPAGAQQAFDKLETSLKSLKGRRFYGIYHTGEYRACVALFPNDQPYALGLERYVIPGGKYIRKKMMQWTERLPEIGKTFTAMGEQYPVDPSRPSVEYYRSQSELHLFLPVL